MTYVLLELQGGEAVVVLTNFMEPSPPLDSASFALTFRPSAPYCLPECVRRGAGQPLFIFHLSVIELN